MKENNLVIDHRQIKKAIGILGIFLPLILIAGCFIFDNCTFVQPSLSQYFYTVMGTVFIGIIFAISIFLFSYKGYADSHDNIVSNLAGSFGLSAAFFPTGMVAGLPCNYVLIEHPSYFSTIHFISSGLFFLTFAYFSIFLFTKKSLNPTPEKLFRNKIYKTCGYLIIAFIIFIFVVQKVPTIKEILGDYKPIFVLETLVLWAFGFSWLVKGEFIFVDKTSKP